MEKICKKCKENKPSIEFSKHYTNCDGYRSECKSCRRSLSKIYYSKNIEKIQVERDQNRAKIRISCQKSWAKNKENYKLKNNLRTKARKASDPQFKLAVALRDRLNKAINGQQKTGSAVSDLGCSIPELKVHLESKFQPGMTWDNWGIFGWHIDHILPLSRFDLTNREQFLKACHYTNLQPLWALQNIKKGAA